MVKIEIIFYLESLFPKNVGPLVRTWLYTFVCYLKSYLTGALRNVTEKYRSQCEYFSFISVEGITFPSAEE